MDRAGDQEGAWAVCEQILLDLAEPGADPTWFTEALS